MLTDGRLSICLVTSTFMPLIGGAETYALTLADGMSSRGHAVTVVTDGWNRSALSDAEQRTMDATFSFDVVRLGEYRSLLDREGVIPWEVLAFGILPELDRTLASKRIDVVATNSLDAAFLGKLISIWRNVPWTATFHEQSPEAEPLGEARLEFVYSVLGPDLIVAGSEFYAARAAAQRRADATVLISHGVDTDRFRPGINGADARRRRKIPVTATVLLCAARLTPRKGIEDLVRAFARLAPDWPDVHLVIAGTVNSSNRAYADFLHDEVLRAGLESRVKFDDSTQPPEMPALFAAADIVVQPSYAEGLGLAVLEALSSGRPVVTTDIPPTHQITKGEDVLVTCAPGDVAALTAAIRTLLSDPARRAHLAAAGREHALQWFSRDAMLRRTEEVLVELVSRWHGREAA